MDNLKRCSSWTGVECINGSCPIALGDEREERGMPSVTSCSECPYNEGCATCDLSGTGRCKEESK